VAIEESASGGPAPTNLAATAEAGEQITVRWNTPQGAIDYFQVERSESLNGEYSVLSPNVLTTSFHDSTVTWGRAYLYRVKAHYANGGYSQYSNKDLATAITFTDDPLSAAVSIKAVHLTEVRLAVDAVRKVAGLSNSPWTDPSPSGVEIKAVHWEELRASLDHALTALSLPTPPYADESLKGLVVQKTHIEELRARVR
jgi:hypothetical protein